MFLSGIHLLSITQTENTSKALQIYPFKIILLTHACVLCRFVVYIRFSFIETKLLLVASILFSLLLECGVDVSICKFMHSWEVEGLWTPVQTWSTMAGAPRHLSAQFLCAKRREHRTPGQGSPENNAQPNRRDQQNKQLAIDSSYLLFSSFLYHLWVFCKHILLNNLENNHGLPKAVWYSD